MEPWLLTAARRDPAKPALITPERTLRYAELYELAARAGAVVQARGAGAGDRVAVALPAGESFVAAAHGALLVGAVLVPVDLRLSSHERALRVGDALLVEEPLDCATPPSGTLSQPAIADLEAPLAHMHTSGTTSRPKSVVLSYRNFLASALGSAAALGLDLNERWLCPMPLVHVGGLSVLIRSAIYGTTVVLHGRFDTDAVLGALSDPAQRTTLVSLVPTMLSRLLDAGLRRPPTLRWALLGGGPIAPALLERAAKAGVPVAPTYGMTEACSQIATRGWPLAGIEVQVALDAEILVRGDCVARGAVADDGWLHTGDLGRWDECGRLIITGRKADTIISGGENVAPSEIEAVLLEHPAVADVAVHGRPDAEWGEAVVAAVVLRPGAVAAPEELRRHCAARLAPFKVPKSIQITQRLPRSETGKLLRRLLR